MKAADALVLSIDLSATALDLAGIDLPSTIQGQSLVPLMTGTANDIRPAALIEYYSNETPFPWTAQLDYRVVISAGHKYIKWLRFDEAELYDLVKDPLWDLSLADALQSEGKHGYPIVFEEAIAGADRFSKGAGRHGEFDS